MRLLSFSAEGFRSLLDIDEIQVGRPTVLTGANDGGKTASLDALGYLLRDYGLKEEDISNVRTTASDGSVELDRVERTAVTGTFALTAQYRTRLGLMDETVKVRRYRRDERDHYEMWTTLPQDPRLRGLADANRQELRQRAVELGVQPVGDGRQAESWRRPLEELASGAPTTQDWTAAPHEVVASLPRYLRFSSTREPDLSSEIQQALRGAYERLLDDDAIVGQVREAERVLQERVEGEAADLCAHIKDRCPDVTEIHVQPSVSFREGFGPVGVRAATAEGVEVAVEFAGAGRRRRMTLAVWEWTRRILDDSHGDARQLIIAYDEPDTHLDYGHQRKLVDLIREQASVGHVGVIVATHSLNLIDKVEIEDVVHLELESGMTRVTRLLSDEHRVVDRHLATISAAMGLRNSVLLHERLFVCVEGPTEAQALPLLFRATTGWSLQAVGLALVAGNSNQGALEVARWLASHDRRVHFIIDADSRQRATRKLFTPQRLRSAGIADDQVDLIGDPNELEELFSDEQWAQVANAAWPRGDGGHWASGDFRALRSEGKFSERLHEMVKVSSESGPASKADCMITLASSISRADDVPSELRAVFEKLIELAA